MKMPTLTNKLGTRLASVVVVTLWASHAAATPRYLGTIDVDHAHLAVAVSETSALALVTETYTLVNRGPSVAETILHAAMPRGATLLEGPSAPGSILALPPGAVTQIDVAYEVSVSGRLRLRLLSVAPDRTRSRT